MSPHVIVQFAAVAILSAFTADTASAQPQTLKLGLPSVSMATVIHRVAQDLNYFEKEGVRVDVHHFESGSINMRALVGRAVDVSDVEIALILAAVSNGADLRVFGTHIQGLQHALYAKRDIRTLRDLAGRSFGVSGIGGLPHVLILALLQRENLDAAKVEMLTVGGTGARLKSLVAGKVDATIGAFNPAIEADANLHRLMIISEELPLYLTQGLAVWSDTIPARRDALERWQRGLVKATRWAHDNKAEFIAAAGKYLPGSAEELGQVYDFNIRARLWAINGEVDPKRLAYMQELGLKTKTQTKAVNLDALLFSEITERAIRSIGRRDQEAQR